jgi:hypothetical protein
MVDCGLSHPSARFKSGVVGTVSELDAESFESYM